MVLWGPPALTQVLYLQGVTTPRVPRSFRDNRIPLGNHHKCIYLAIPTNLSSDQILAGQEISASDHERIGKYSAICKMGSKIVCFPY